MMCGREGGSYERENEREVGQPQLRHGTGMILTVSPPSPGSAWLKNSCCIVTLGSGPENCQPPNYRHFSLVL